MMSSGNPVARLLIIKDGKQVIDNPETHCFSGFFGRTTDMR